MDERQAHELLTRAAEAAQPAGDLSARAERRYLRRRNRARTVVIAVVAVLVGSGVATAAVVNRANPPSESRRPKLPHVFAPVNPNLFVSLAFVNATTGYAVETEGARYVLAKTVDGGRSFAALAFLPAGAANIEIDNATKPLPDLLAWGGRGLSITSDDGEHWARTLPGPIGAVASSSHRIWASVTCPSAAPCPTRVATSDDNGVSWHDTTLRPAGIGALAIVAPSRSTAYVVEHGVPSRWEVASTSDGGAHWTRQTTPCVYNVGGGIVAGAPPRITLGDDGHSMMLVCSDGTVEHAYVSSGRPNSWSPLAPLPASSPVLAIGTVGPSEFVVGLGGAWNKGPLVAPVADQWSLPVVHQPFGNVRALTVLPGGGVFYATNESGVWYSRSEKYERRAAPAPGTPATIPGRAPEPSGPVDASTISALSFVNANLGFGIAGTSVVRTDDGGRTWTRVGGLGLDVPDDVGGSEASGLYFADDLNGVLWGGGPLQFTDDGGKSWSLPDAILSDNQLGWAGGRLWSFTPCADGEQCDPQPLEISDDSGKTWQETASLPRGAGAADLLVTSRLDAYVVEPVPNHPADREGPWRLALTRDGGSSWSYEPIPCTMTAFPSLAFNGRALVLVCSSEPAGATSLQQTRVSGDEGRHWSAGAIPGGNSANLRAFDSTFIGVEGRGSIVTSTDDGQSWQIAIATVENFGAYVDPLPGVGVWVATGRSDSDSGIWFSADGVHWEERATGEA